MNVLPDCLSVYYKSICDILKRKKRPGWIPGGEGGEHDSSNCIYASKAVTPFTSQ